MIPDEPLQDEQIDGTPDDLSPEDRDTENPDVDMQQAAQEEKRLTDNIVEMLRIYMGDD